MLYSNNFSSAKFTYGLVSRFDATSCKYNSVISEHRMLYISKEPMLGYLIFLIFCFIFQLHAVSRLHVAGQTEALKIFIKTFIDNVNKVKPNSNKSAFAKSFVLVYRAATHTDRQTETEKSSLSRTKRKYFYSTLKKLILIIQKH